MNIDTNPNLKRPQPLLSAASRIACAAVAVAFLCVAWSAAERASVQAVQTDVQAFMPGTADVAQSLAAIAAHRERAPTTPVRARMAG